MKHERKSPLEDISVDVRTILISNLKSKECEYTFLA
jgi:hypothetical protein